MHDELVWSELLQISRTLKCPQDARLEIGDGQLALHAAVQQGSPQVVRLILEAYPEAARHADDEGDIPLNFVFMSWGDRQREIIPMLLEAWPDSVRHVSALGDLPLHCACEDNPPC